MSEQAILKAIRPHVAERNSSMHLRQGSKRCIIPELGSTAQHSLYIQHIPTQHLHWPHEPQVTEDGTSQLQLRLGNLFVILDVLGTWGAECKVHAREGPHPRMLSGQRGRVSIRKPRRQRTGQSKQISQSGPSISPGHRPIFAVHSKSQRQWRLRYHCGND